MISRKSPVTFEILRSTTVTVGSWMFLVGSLMFLACANYLSGQRAAILLLGGGSVAVVVGLISQNNDKRGFSQLVHRIVDSHKTVALMTLNTLILFACLELAAAFVA